jgi:hypothetical protein
MAREAGTVEEPPGGQGNASGPAPQWADAGWEATARAWAAPVTCRECGAESTGATGVCARCGAPLSLEPPAASAPPAGWPGPAGGPGIPAPPADWPGAPAPPTGWPGVPAPPAGGPGIPGPPMPWDPLYYWAPGQQPNSGNSRRRVLIVAGAGGALLLALIAVIGVWVATSRPAAFTPTASASAPTQLSWYDLAPGDCLAGSNMSLGNTTTPWPDYVTQVDCTKPHEAEVFFAGDLWPSSAAYPGKSTIDNETWSRCNTTFTKYDGIDASFEGNDPPSSAFTFTDIADDDSAGWTSGEHRLVCVAYKPDFNNVTSGATPVDYSIKGTKK